MEMASSARLLWTFSTAQGPSGCVSHQPRQRVRLPAADQITARQLAVVRVSRHVEHHVAVISNVSVTFGNQLLFSDFDNFSDMVRSTRLQIRAQNIQRIIKIAYAFPRSFCRPTRPAFTVFIRAR